MKRARSPFVVGLATLGVAAILWPTLAIGEWRNVGFWGEAARIVTLRFFVNEGFDVDNAIGQGVKELLIQEASRIGLEPSPRLHEGHDGVPGSNFRFKFETGGGNSDDLVDGINAVVLRNLGDRVRRRCQFVGVLACTDDRSGGHEMIMLPAFRQLSDGEIREVHLYGNTHPNITLQNAASWVGVGGCQPPPVGANTQAGNTAAIHALGHLAGMPNRDDVPSVMNTSNQRCPFLTAADMEFFRDRYPDPITADLPDAIDSFDLSLRNQVVVEDQVVESPNPFGALLGEQAPGGPVEQYRDAGRWVMRVPPGSRGVYSLSLLNLGRAFINESDGPMPTVRFYLSTDTQVDNGDAILVTWRGSNAFQMVNGTGTRVGVVLPSGIAMPLNVDFTLPQVMPDGIGPRGRYRLLAVADPGNAISESNETNNKVEHPFLIEVSDAPPIVYEVTTSFARGQTLRAGEPHWVRVRKTECAAGNGCGNPRYTAESWDGEELSAVVGRDDFFGLESVSNSTVATGFGAGQVSFRAPSQEGLFEFRYLVNGEPPAQAVSNTVRVRQSAGDSSARITTFNTDPANILGVSRGQQVTLVWETSGAAACSASEGWTGDKPLSGREVITPQRSAIYVLTCRDAQGRPATRHLILLVDPANEARWVMAFPREVRPGESVSVWWNLVGGTLAEEDYLGLYRVGAADEVPRVPWASVPPMLRGQNWSAYAGDAVYTEETTAQDRQRGIKRYKYDFTPSTTLRPVDPFDATVPPEARRERSDLGHWLISLMAWPSGEVVSLEDARQRGLLVVDTLEFSVEGESVPVVSGPRLENGIVIGNCQPSTACTPAGSLRAEDWPVTRSPLPAAPRFGQSLYALMLADHGGETSTSGDITLRWGATVPEQVEAYKITGRYEPTSCSRVTIDGRPSVILFEDEVGPGETSQSVLFDKEGCYLYAIQVKHRGTLGSPTLILLDAVSPLRFVDRELGEDVTHLRGMQLGRLYHVIAPVAEAFARQFGNTRASAMIEYLQRIPLLESLDTVDLDFTSGNTFEASLFEDLGEVLSPFANKGLLSDVTWDVTNVDTFESTTGFLQLPVLNKVQWADGVLKIRALDGAGNNTVSWVPGDPAEGAIDRFWILRPDPADLPRTVEFEVSYEGAPRTVGIQALVVNPDDPDNAQDSDGDGVPDNWFLTPLQAGQAIRQEGTRTIHTFTADIQEEDQLSFDLRLDLTIFPDSSQDDLDTPYRYRAEGFAANIAFLRAQNDAFFVRGDSNQDGILDTADASHMLNYMFLGGPQPGCLDAADVDDDGKMQINDAVYLLTWRYLGSGNPPPRPNLDTGAGPDPTADTLTCESYHVP